MSRHRARIPLTPPLPCGPAAGPACSCRLLSRREALAPEVGKWQEHQRRHKALVSGKRSLLLQLADALLCLESTHGIINIKILDKSPKISNCFV